MLRLYSAIALAVVVSTFSEPVLAGYGIDLLPQAKPLSNGCRWYYYRAREFASVLNCSSLGLTTTPNSKIFGMRRGIAIWMDNNNLDVITATAFDTSDRTEFLYLDNNQITTIYAGAFDVMVELRVLTLGKNRFSSFPNGMFSHMKLEFLDLSDNQLSSLSSQQTNSYGSALRWLNLNRNNIRLVKCGFFISGKLNYLSMTGNPSVCKITKLGEVDCLCSNAYGDGPGYCDNACKGGAAPENLLSAGVMPVNSSWKKMVSLLNDISGHPYMLTNISAMDKIADRVDIVKKNKANDDVSSGETGTGTIATIAICVAVVTMAAIATVFGARKLRRSRRNSAHDGTATTSVISTDESQLQKTTRLSHMEDTTMTDVNWDNTMTATTSASVLECKESEP